MKKYNLKRVFLALFLSASSAIFSQNIAMNLSGSNANPAAILDLSGNPNLGFLMPTVTLTSITLASPISSPPAGLVVYNSSSSTANGLSGAGFYYWSGTEWLYLLNSATTTSSGDTGTTSYVARWTNSTTLGTGVTQDNGSGVGISASPITPQSSLDVNGGVAIGSYAGNNAAPTNGVIISGNVGIGTSSPDTAAAALDTTSSTQGVLIPRMASNPISTATGLMYYNTTTNCFVFWTGTAWQNMFCACSGAPAQPGSINGITTYSANQTGVSYSISPVTGAVYYTWSVPTGATITAGQGTTGITVNFGSASGNVSVTSNNSCAASAPSTLPVMVDIQYIPITITNSQGTATPNNFVQMITVNSSTYSGNNESSGLQNVEFSTGPAGSGTPLYAWIESGATSASTSTVYWVNLGTSIPASSSYTVYMNFMPSTIVTSTTGYTGVAPQLFGGSYYATSYGEYDNGALVFPAYFNGNTPISSFNYGSNAGVMTSTTDASFIGGLTLNVLNFYQNDASGNDAAFIYTAQALPVTSGGGYLGESYFRIPANDATNMGVLGFFDGTSGTPVNAISNGTCDGGDYFQQMYITNNTTNAGNNSQGSAVETPIYANVQWTGTSATSYYGYNAPQLYSITTPGTGYAGTVNVNPLSVATNLYLGIFSKALINVGDINVNWMRARPNPPNSTSSLTGNIGNTMPTVSFGSVQ